MRGPLSLETENLYMFVKYNMLPLEEKNPKLAVISWIKKNRIGERSNN